MSRSRDSKKTEEVKQQLVEFWQCANKLTVRNNVIFVFLVLLGNAEAKLFQLA